MSPLTPTSNSQSEGKTIRQREDNKKREGRVSRRGVPDDYIRQRRIELGHKQCFPSYKVGSNPEVDL